MFLLSVFCSVRVSFRMVLTIEGNDRRATAEGSIRKLISIFRFLLASWKWMRLCWEVLNFISIQVLFRKLGYGKVLNVAQRP